MAKNIRKFWFLIPLTLGACAAPSVNLATPEPIKIDIGMRLDVYQHADPNMVAAAKAKPAAAPVPASPAAAVTTATDPVAAQKARAVEIQNFKNSRWVGEGRDGLLIIIEPLPGGDEGEAIRKVVQQENRDRKRIMREQAEAQKKNLTEIQALYALEWRNRSFSGEYVEMPQSGGTYLLIQKAE